MKRIGIWIATMVFMVFLANLASTLVNKKLYCETLLSSLTGYSKRIVLPLSSDGTENGDKGVKAVIMLRSMLSDTVLQNENLSPLPSLLFADLNIEQSSVFHGPEGPTELSAGIFSPVYKDEGQRVYLTETIGILNVTRFSELDCSKQLYEVLEDNKNATVRLDSYSVDNYIVEPAKITVLDESGNEISTIECPCSGEVQKGDSIVILNRYENSSDLESLYVKLRDAYRSDRSSDKTAEKLSEKLDFSKGDYNEDKTVYGLGKFTLEHTEVIDGNGMALVLECSYLKGVIVHSLILGVIATIVLLIIFRKRA